MDSLNLLRNALAIKGLLSIVKPIVDRHKGNIVNKPQNITQISAPEDEGPGVDIEDNESSLYPLHNAERTMALDIEYKKRASKLLNVFEKSISELPDTTTAKGKSDALKLERMYSVANIRIKEEVYGSQLVPNDII